MESLRTGIVMPKKTERSEERARKQPACSVEVEGTFAGRKSQAV